MNTTTTDPRAMSTSALDACLSRHREHAAMTRLLDEELGTLHGLAWSDFVLLDALESAGGSLPATRLGRELGMLRSALVRQLLPLEKVGLVTRVAGPDGATEVRRGPSARRLVREARETAAALCAKAAASAASGLDC